MHLIIYPFIKHLGLLSLWSSPTDEGKYFYTTRRGVHWRMRLYPTSGEVKTLSAPDED